MSHKENLAECILKLKKEIKDEMLEIVTGALAEIKMYTLPAPPPAHCSHRPRNKPEKRLRKTAPIFPECVPEYELYFTFFTGFQLISFLISALKIL